MRTRSNSRPTLQKGALPCRATARGRVRVASDAGFSFLRLVLILLLITLVTVIVAPLATDAADRMARDREERMLQTLIAGLKGHILRHRTIPDGPRIVGAVASELRVKPDNVRQNPRSIQRVFLLHPQFEDVFSLPYRQDWRGVAELSPDKMRAMVVSCLSKELPAQLVQDSPIRIEDFEALWRAGSSAVPGDWEWNGGWDDVQISRLDLADLFVEVRLLQSGRSESDKARFVVDGKGDRNDPAVRKDFRSYYLRGSVMEFYDDTGDRETLSLSAVVREGVSFVCRGGHWSRGGALAKRATDAQGEPEGDSGVPHDEADFHDG